MRNLDEIYANLDALDDESTSSSGSNSRGEDSSDVEEIGRDEFLTSRREVSSEIEEIGEGDFYSAKRPWERSHRASPVN